MKKLAMFAVAASVLFIFGCGQEVPAEKLRTVEWFKANAPERKAKLEMCLSKPMDQASTHNCVNAIRASNPEAWGRTGVGSSPVGSIVVHDIDR